MKFERAGIVVELVLKSINTLNGARMMTVRCHYPRIIHAEVKTHSALKTNSASSRAVPVKAMNDSILRDVAMPLRFGANQSGMQDMGGEHDGVVDLPLSEDGISGRNAWKNAAYSAIVTSNALSDAGYHKQVCNRITEPFQWMDVVMSGSEWANFLWLRCDEDADPTLQVLADLCLQAYQHDSWDKLGNGDWYLPFVKYHRCLRTFNQLWYTHDVDGNEVDLTLEEAQLVSMSVAAQASFRKADASLEKALVIKEKLFSGKKVHASPSEHQAMVVGIPDAIRPFHHVPEGVTHITVDGRYGSGNLMGWVQLRQLIKNNHQTNMDEVLEYIDNKDQAL